MQGVSCERKLESRGCDYVLNLASAIALRRGKEYKRVYKILVFAVEININRNKQKRAKRRFTFISDRY